MVEQDTYVEGLSVQVTELVGSAALPVIEALESPLRPELVARAARPSLEDLCARADLPRELHASARTALLAARCLTSREPGVQAYYAQLLRSTGAMLRQTGLPSPCELDG